MASLDDKQPTGLARPTPRKRPTASRDLTSSVPDSLTVSVKLPKVVRTLPEDEAAEFREGPSAVGEIARRLFDAVDLITFFTAGEKETRAWPLRRGETALAAAETIHSDIARGFIRCEVILWSDLVDAGSRAEVVKRGRQRLEGKDYVVQDGDVVNIRFNV